MGEENIWAHAALSRGYDNSTLYCFAFVFVGIGSGLVVDVPCGLLMEGGGGAIKDK